jgi:microcystin-dependent protein
MSVRDKPPAPGASPTGANEGLFGVLQAFIRSPQFVAVMADHGFVKTAPGDLKCAASADAPPGGWLLCDFSLYPVSTYPALAAVLFKAGYEQAPYAPGGPPPGQFYVPDFRHVTMVGSDPANGSGLGALSLADFGGYAGRALNTLSIANLPAHTHPPATPGTNFLLTDASAVLQSAGAGGFKYSTGFNATTGATGSGSGFTAMPPFTSVNIWIKT